MFDLCSLELGCWCIHVQMMPERKARDCGWLVAPMQNKDLPQGKQTAGMSQVYQNLLYILQGPNVSRL